MEEEDCGKETGGVLKAPSLLSSQKRNFAFIQTNNSDIYIYILFFLKCVFFFLPFSDRVFYHMLL